MEVIQKTFCLNQDILIYRQGIIDWQNGNILMILSGTRAIEARVQMPRLIDVNIKEIYNTFFLNLVRNLKVDYALERNLTTHWDHRFVEKEYGIRQKNE